MYNLTEIKKVLKQFNLVAPTIDTIVDGCSSEVWTGDKFWVGLGLFDDFASVTFFDLQDHEQYSIQAAVDQKGYKLSFEDDFEPEFFLTTVDLKTELEKVLVTYRKNVD